MSLAAGVDAGQAASRSEFTVVGAGMAGLSAALMLARAGHQVRVLERGPEVGGLASRHVFRGVECDLGSHRLHREAIDHPLFHEMGQKLEFLDRPRNGILVLHERRIGYPPSIAGLMLGLGARHSAQFALSVLLRQRISRWESDRVALRADGDVGFELFVKQRVGQAAFDAFYRPYVEKVWGLPASEISQTVAKSRLSTASPLAAISRFAQPRVRSFVYPSGGIGSLIRYLAEQLSGLGVTIETNARYHAAEHARKTVLFSGRLGDLVDTELEHRGLYLVYLAFKRRQLSDHETYYTPESKYWFGRVSELKNYSPRLGRKDETVLVVEIPEGRWGPSQRFDSGGNWQTLQNQLREAGIVASGLEPIAIDQRYLPEVYPLYRRGWVDRWREALERVSRFGNVLPFGRQGLHLHCNLHHCVQMSDDVTRHALSAGSARSWIAHVERYHGFRVLD